MNVNNSVWAWKAITLCITSRQAIPTSVFPLINGRLCKSPVTLLEKGSCLETERARKASKIKCHLPILWCPLEARNPISYRAPRLAMNKDPQGDAKPSTCSPFSLGCHAAPQPPPLVLSENTTSAIVLTSPGPFLHATIWKTTKNSANE